MRLLAVLFIGVVGLVLGAIAGFLGAVFTHPEASPTYAYWGSLLGMVTLLWITGSFGTLIYGGFCGLLGAMVGGGLCWILDRLVFHVGPSLPHGGMIVGAVLFSLWPPSFARRSSSKVSVRGRDEGRRLSREAEGFRMPSSSGGPLPSAPPYQSDGRLLGLRQLQNELREIAPGIDVGIAGNGDEPSIPEDVSFYAADRGFVEGEFQRYLSLRMEAEGIREWEDEKFDCDDFAHYLKTCASLSIKGSPLKGGSHTFFVAVVGIRPGESLLGIPGGTNALHANNLVRCTDGCWYFVEPQSALRRSAAGLIPMPLARIPAAASILRQVQSGSGSDASWICPLESALEGRRGPARLLQAKF